MDLVLPGGATKAEDPQAVLSCLRKHLDRSGRNAEPCSRSKKARYEPDVVSDAQQESDDEEIGALVETLKKEMMASFERVAEQSVRRLLERLVRRNDGGRGKQRVREKSANSCKQGGCLFMRLYI